MNFNKSFSNLYTLLINNGFNSKLLYNNINLLKKIKSIFNSIFIPELIYFDKYNIIIFETNTNYLNNIDFYTKNINIKKYNIFGITFKNVDDYIIYKLENNKLNIIKSNLIPELLNKESEKLDMNNEIHKVHNYIRDYTKISNEDKSFFIAIILISIKKASFEYIFELYKNKNYIYDILLENLKDYDIDIHVFKFLKSDENNIHLYNLIEMISKIYKKNPSIDLLNEFYNEFVKYNNTDGKKLGIVLTPSHIVSLMTDILKINKNDIVLDLCTGTGSYLLEAHKYNPKKIIGCEYQNKLYALLKCNMILRNIINCEIIKGDCFKHEFKATKSLINPPYSMKDKNEMDFILKQLESIEDEGECCAIIPIGKITNNPRNTYYKKLLMEIADIKTIIICKKELFYPNANIQCCIIHLKKTNNKLYQTKIIDYIDDGYEIQMNNGLIKTDKFDLYKEELYKRINEINNKTNKLIIDDDWHIEKKELILDINNANKQLKLMELELEYLKRKQEILSNNEIHNISINNIKYYKIEELFNLENVKNPLQLKYKYITGDIPLISATKYNNGISNRIEKQENIILNNKHCLIFSTVGTCFYQENDFYATSSIKILRPINNLITDIIMKKIAILIMNTYLIKYNKLRGFKYEIFKETVIKTENLNL